MRNFTGISCVKFNAFLNCAAFAVAKQGISRLQESQCPGSSNRKSLATAPVHASDECFAFSKITARPAVVSLAEPPPSRRIDEGIQEEEEAEEAGTESLVAKQTVPLNAVADQSDFKQPPEQVSETFVWRINLTKSEPFWTGWFEGLSGLFLSAPTHAKMLLLAGVDRLDKTLTIGQMQGTKDARLVFHVQSNMDVLPQASFKCKSCRSAVTQSTRTFPTK